MALFPADVSLAAMQDADRIRLVLEAKANALVARNPESLNALIHDDFVYVNAGGRKFDKAEYVEAYCTSGRVVFSRQLFSMLAIKLIDDFAVATMSVDDEFRVGERVVSARYISLCVFARSSGSWRWAAGQTMTLGSV